MSKRLLPVLLLVATAALAACSDDGDSGDSGAAGDPAPTTAAPATTEPASGSCEYVTDDLLPVAKEVNPPPSSPTVSGQVGVTMTTSVGDFQLTLDADRAPCTVNSFVSLAQQGYFDDTSCHRLTTAGIKVLQCGDPTGQGTGGPGYTFADETDGSETYGPGVLAMANRGPDTNGSQFFIVYGDSPLDPDYTVFGSVDDATLAAVEKVAAKGTDNANGQGDGAPLTPVDIEQVTVNQ